MMNGILATIFPLGDVFKATGRQWLLIALNLLLLPLLVVAIVLAAPVGVLTVAWIRTAEVACFAALFLVAVRRVLKVPMRRLLAALRPALSAAVGVLLGSGGVRLAWSALELAPLIVATVAGGVGGVAALRALDPVTFSELRALVALRSRRRVHGPTATSLLRRRRGWVDGQDGDEESGVEPDESEQSAAQEDAIRKEPWEGGLGPP